MEQGVVASSTGLQYPQLPPRCLGKHMSLGRLCSLTE
jgi:hypothetical protein